MSLWYVSQWQNCSRHRTLDQLAHKVYIPIYCDFTADMSQLKYSWRGKMKFLA